VAERQWRVRESARLTPKSTRIGAAWSIRSTSHDGSEVRTTVEVSRDAIERLQDGVVAEDTRLALRTQGRSPVETAVKQGDEPPPRIVCTPEGCKARAARGG